MDVLLTVVSYIAVYVLLRISHVNGDYGTACAVFVSVVVCLFKSRSGIVMQWLKMSIAVTLAASLVLLVSRYFGDVGRGEDTATFLFMVVTYWLAGSVISVAGGLLRRKMFPREDDSPPTAPL